MLERRRKAMLAAFAGVAAGIYPWACHPAPENSWPDRAVTMIVPFPPGGPTDMVARLLAKQLSVQIGQGVVVQNMPGANGIVGMRYVARTRPDGYTILYNTSSLVLSPHIYLDPGFDPIKDFEAVSSTAAMPLVLLVHPAMPVSDFDSFIAHARQRAGNLSYASAGAGNVTHVAAVLLARSTNIRAMHVPYRGSAPALAGLMVGQTQFMLNPVGDALVHIRAGRLRALAVTAKERIAALADVPAVAELGVPGFEVTAWQGVLAPKGVPVAVIERLNNAIRLSLASDDMQSQLTARSAQTLGSTPADYTRFIHEEDKRWGTIIRAADVRPQ